MQIIYNLSIYLYKLLILIASLFNHKAKLWLKGRKNIFDSLHLKFKNNTSKTVWVHCASLGEFEQGRPLIEKIKKTYPEIKIFLTFFSPSGYEIRKNYSEADYIFYLPLDTTSNAKKLIDIVKPTAVFFIKYEFWFNYLNALKEKNIPTYLISGIFRPNHYFFKSYALWYRNQLKNFNYFFVQNETSKSLLNSIEIQNVTIAGDTRFDRVYEISQQTKEFEIIRAFCENKKIIVAGSTWEEDEKILSSFDFNNSKLIIAPHEIDENHLKNIETLFKKKKILRYSKANIKDVKDYSILIIDNIGMLSSLYKYGSIAYIGGGFGSGIHNILEAATFGLPVLFGPNYKKFSEAIELINMGGAFSITNESDFRDRMIYLDNENNLKQASKICKNYIENNIGATEIILKNIVI